MVAAEETTSNRLNVTVEETGDFSVVKLAGAIDEDNDLSEISTKIKKDKVVIDTGNIERINSCGVRDWVHWLGELDKKGFGYYLTECSPAIIAQVNLVNNFVGSGAIITFLAPYYCDTCKADKLLRVSVSDILSSKPVRPPSCRCDQCDHTLEFDDIEKYYFGFLAQAEKKEVDAATRDTVMELTAGEEKLRTKGGYDTSAQLSQLKGAAQSALTPSNPYVYGPTMPSPVKPKGLLTGDTSDPGGAGGEAKRPSMWSNPRVVRLIYVMIFLMVLAIGMMVFAILYLA